MDRETFVQLELHGHADEIKAFVEGFRLALGEDRVFSAARENVKIEGFLGTLVSRAHRSTYLLVPESFVKPLTDALDAADQVEIDVESLRHIDHAEMEFGFRCFSREDGVAIRQVVETELPAGVVLEGFTVDEVLDEGAAGSELYSPVHEYVLIGEGRYHGPLEGVLALGRRLDDQDFIHPERVHLVYNG